MPALKNPRHERFAQALAKGKTASEAYKEAGYAPNRGNCIRLKDNESVRKRLAELQEPIAKKAQITLARLLEMAEAVYDAAKAAGQNAAAIAAVKELGVLSGERVERRENGAPGEFEAMTDHDLDAFIAQREGLLGSGAGREGTSPVSAKVRGKPH